MGIEKTYKDVFLEAFPNAKLATDNETPLACINHVFPGVTTTSNCLDISSCKHCWGKIYPRKIIAVDFDGTLCENNWPECGRPNWKLIKYLIDQQKRGAKLILWTNRIGDKLTEASFWCLNNGLVFDALNENLPETIERFGGDTRKVYADEYIDDRSSVIFKLPYISGMES